MLTANSGPSGIGSVRHLVKYSPMATTHTVGSPTSIAAASSEEPDVYGSMLVPRDAVTDAPDSSSLWGFQFNGLPPGKYHADLQVSIATATARGINGPLTASSWALDGRSGVALTGMGITGNDTVWRAHWLVNPVAQSLTNYRLWGMAGIFTRTVVHVLMDMSRFAIWDASGSMTLTRVYFNGLPSYKPSTENS